MAIIKGVKRLDRTDFPADVPEWIDYLLDPLNTFLDSSISALRGNINFDNLRRTLKKYTFTDSTELQVSHNYNGKVGIEVVYCEDYFRIKTRQIDNNTIGVSFKFESAGSQEVTFAIVADI